MESLEKWKLYIIPNLSGICDKLYLMFIFRKNFQIMEIMYESNSQGNQIATLSSKDELIQKKTCQERMDSEFQET